jgi:hypothetical protein
MKRYTNGFEIVDGKVYLRTTTVLKIIEKPALMYWFGKEVFYALSQNPELSEKEALAMPYQVSAKAKDRGTTVHSIVEAFKSTEKRIETIPQHIQPYAFAFYDFMRDHGLEMIDNEKKVYSDEHMLSGTLDIYGKLGDKHFIIDVKTGKDIYMEAGLQLSAYKHMFDKPVDDWRDQYGYKKVLEIILEWLKG